MKIERAWGMPNAETFSIKPVGEFVQRYMAPAKTSVDPFARNRNWATHTNDIDPKTAALSHQDAEAFVLCLERDGVRADLVLFDPPYSTRQISEHYKAVGLPVTKEDTQNGRLFKRVRDAIDRIVIHGGVVLSFGWSSNGMGLTRGYGYEILEILLVAHGGAHNDTICMAEVKR